MPFRERMRKVLGRDPDGLQKTKSKQTDAAAANGNGDFPKPKYGNRVNPEHQAKLKSYDLSNAFGSLRRKSMAKSDISPGNSRRSSAINESRKSVGRTPLGVSALSARDQDDENVDPSQKHTSSIPNPIAEESPPKAESLRRDGESNGVPPQSAPLDSEELARKLTQTKLEPSQPGGVNGVVQTPQIAATGA